jgi:hypothetical protein
MEMEAFTGKLHAYLRSVSTQGAVNEWKRLVVSISHKFAIAPA